MLGRLIPEKQILNDQLKQVQQNSLHSRCFLFKVDIFLPHRQEMRTWKAVFPHCQFVFLISPCFSKTGDSLLPLKRALEAKELARQQLRDQLDEVEKETRSKLQEIDIFNNQLKVPILCVPTCMSYFVNFSKWPRWLVDIWPPGRKIYSAGLSAFIKSPHIYRWTLNNLSWIFVL